MNPEADIHPSQRDRQLPMIVNLRGDEDMVVDFCIDADQAMEFLGIKRSRLTQISGRELRVGRVRRDRYLRPYYRESDLRDYQEWTRATATHQTSSKAIEQAVDRLDDRFNDVFVVLHERLEQFQMRENMFLRERFAHLQKQWSLQLQGLISLVEGSGRILEQNQRDAQLQRKAQGRIEGAQAESLKLLAESGQRSENFHQDLREALLRLKNLRSEVAGLNAPLLDAIQAQAASQTEALAHLELTITSHLQASENRLVDLVRELQAEKLVERAHEERPRPRRARVPPRRRAAYFQNY